MEMLLTLIVHVDLNQIVHMNMYEYEPVKQTKHLQHIIASGGREHLCPRAAGAIISAWAQEARAAHLQGWDRAGDDCAATVPVGDTVTIEFRRHWCLGFPCL